MQTEEPNHIIGVDEQMQFVPFNETMIDAGAGLLAENYSHLRSKGLSLLPERFEEIATAREALLGVFEQPKAMGIAALSDGKLMAYLIGCPAVNAIRGRHVWIHPAGIGADSAYSLDILRDLYTHLGRVWVRNGFFDHFILTFAEGDWLIPWLNLGFASEQAHALMDLKKVHISRFSVNPRLVVREAGQEDRSIVQSFSRIIPREHAGAPVWGVALPEDIPEIHEGYGELLDEEGTTTWLAFLDNEPVGIQVYRTLPDQGINLLYPSKSTRLTVASTIEQARGMGVSTTLLARGLADALSKGFRYCETDWRVTNLLSSRHWPRRGFTPVGYRLVRKVDPRIVWADGYNEL